MAVVVVGRGRSLGRLVEGKVIPYHHEADENRMRRRSGAVRVTVGANIRWGSCRMT